jgi:hypothetical protein
MQCRSCSPGYPKTIGGLRFILKIGAQPGVDPQLKNTIKNVSQAISRGYLLELKVDYKMYNLLS